MTPEEERELMQRARDARLSASPSAPVEQPTEAPLDDKGLLQIIKENLVGDNDPTTQNFGEKVGTWLNTAGESMTGGLIGDEASAAVESLIPGVDSADRRDHYRSEQEALAESNPIAALSADVAGALLPVGGVSLAAKGAGMLPRILASGATGAAQGGLYGYMEGETPEERLEQGALGAGIGAGVGAAMPPVIAGASRVGGALLEPIKSAFNIGNNNRASRAIATALSRSGKTMDDVVGELNAARAAGQPEFLAVDALGNPGQRMLAGISKQPGEARTEIVDALMSRQADQVDRISANIADDFGFRGAPARGTDIVPTGHELTDDVASVLARPQRSAAMTEDALKSARRTTANANYDAARGAADPADVRRAVDNINAYLGGADESGLALTDVDKKVLKARNMLISKSPPQGVNSLELSDFDKLVQVKSQLGAAAERADGFEQTKLRAIVKDIDAALEKASSGYRQANDTFASDSGVIDALTKGKEMRRPSNRAVNTVEDFGTMTPDQQRAARIGYGDALLGNIENKPVTANAASDFRKTKLQKEVDAMALDPDRFNERMAREQTMFDTTHHATGGSPTAENTADILDMQQFDAGAIVNLLRGNIGTASAQIYGALANVAKGQNEATRAIIGRVLMSDDPAKALAAAIQREANDQTRRALISAASTALGLRGSQEAIQAP